MVTTREKQTKSIFHPTSPASLTSRSYWLMHHKWDYFWDLISNITYHLSRQGSQRPCIWQSKALHFALKYRGGIVSTSVVSNTNLSSFPLIHQVACSIRAATEKLSLCFKAAASIAREHTEAAFIRMWMCPVAPALNPNPKSRADLYSGNWGRFCNHYSCVCFNKVNPSGRIRFFQRWRPIIV